jgi:hypothetical protein
MYFFGCYSWRGLRLRIAFDGFTFSVAELRKGFIQPFNLYLPLTRASSHRDTESLSKTKGFLRVLPRHDLP